MTECAQTGKFYLTTESHSVHAARMSKEHRHLKLSGDDLKEIEDLNPSQQLALASELERRALAIRQHALTLQKRKKKAGNGHHADS